MVWPRRLLENPVVTKQARLSGESPWTLSSKRAKIRRHIRRWQRPCDANQNEMTAQLAQQQLQKLSKSKRPCRGVWRT